MSLANKYRPKLFKHVVGQEAAVKALQSAVSEKSMRCFLFSGPSGVGKTTLARIVAAKFECEIQEIDAATFTGIDEMRQVQESAQYVPFGSVKGRAIIIDEAHGLSRQAWDSLLKATEEPPPNVFWFFCTTNPDKVPTTIKTRSFPLQLRPLSRDHVYDLIEHVCAGENIKMDDSMKQLIVAESNGSARQALVYLEVCRGAKTRQEVASLLHSAQENESVLVLCKFVTNGGSWKDAAKILQSLNGENPEGIRIQVAHYLNKAILNARNDKDAQYLLGRLEYFSFPFGQSDGSPQLTRAIGACVFSADM